MPDTKFIGGAVFGEAGHVLFANGQGIMGGDPAADPRHSLPKIIAYSLHYQCLGKQREYDPGSSSFEDAPLGS
jgi:hypothetical protein